jgi:hypothetical protein
MDPGAFVHVRWNVTIIITSGDVHGAVDTACVHLARKLE